MNKVIFGYGQWTYGFNNILFSWHFAIYIVSALIGAAPDRNGEFGAIKWHVQLNIAHVSQ